MKKTRPPTKSLGKDGFQTGLRQLVGIEFTRRKISRFLRFRDKGRRSVPWPTEDHETGHPPKIGYVTRPGKAEPQRKLPTAPVSSGEVWRDRVLVK